MRIPSAIGSTQRARQLPIGPYVCDFVCMALVVVEVDGEQHAFDTAHDDVRTEYLKALGFDVLRFWNPDVLRATDDVVATIYAALADRRAIAAKTPTLPSP